MACLIAMVGERFAQFGIHERVGGQFQRIQIQLFQQFGRHLETNKLHSYFDIGKYSPEIRIFGGRRTAAFRHGIINQWGIALGLGHRHDLRR